MATAIARVAVPGPLRRLLDYRLGEHGQGAAPGVRVRVPFGRGERIGLLVELAAASEVEPGRLKDVAAVLDAEPLLSPALLRLLAWTAAYYHHPVGEVAAAMLPPALRRGAPAGTATPRRWRLAPAAGEHAAPARAHRQRHLLELLGQFPEGLGERALQARLPGWRTAARALLDKGLLIAEDAPATPAPDPLVEAEAAPPLSPEQQRAVSALREACGFTVWLLEGVTGSGKTEVYLQAVAHALGQGLQALVLVPEIGLTPQTVGRFRARFGAAVVLYHSGLAEGERRRAWHAAREGRAGVVVGTRSAVFLPLARPGVVVVDEEHDASYKQHEGLRYSARDVAVMRARMEGVPVVLGSATPALESLHNAARGRYRHLELPTRVGGGQMPTVRLLDVRGERLRNGLSQALLAGIAARLGRGEQVLLFLNRRGWSPVVLCTDCGWVAECAHCDAPLTYHRGRGRLECHHCGASTILAAACPSCASAGLLPLGQGTERVEEALGTAFPEARLLRLDRDSARGRGALEDAHARLQAGEVDILVGTQMVTKGHHFPRLTLVGILDTDGGLYSVDFRAAERMAQQVVQVAGRAGRGRAPGEVLLQTYHPRHPLLQALVSRGYRGFADRALGERESAALPPFAHLALARAEAGRAEDAAALLAAAREAAPAAADVMLLGPVAAPRERIGGRYRQQLLAQAGDRRVLHAFLAAWVPRIEALPAARRVRWSLDVDPQDLA